MKEKILKSFFVMPIILSIILFRNIVYAQSNYTEVKSQTLFEQGTTDNIELDYISFPTVKVEGVDYTNEVKSSIASPDKQAKYVNLNNVSPGQQLDNTITVTYEAGGKMNNKRCNIKLIYSDILIGKSEETPCLYWTKSPSDLFGCNNIEHMKLQIYLCNINGTPLNINDVYMTMNIRENGATVISKNATKQFIKEGSNLKYDEDKNSFKLEGVNEEKICFQYKNLEYIDIELYTSSSIAYQFAFTPLTVEPSLEPSTEPTEEPTVEEPSLEPSTEPTEEPTVEISPELTPESIIEPLLETTPELTIEPTIEPVNTDLVLGSKTRTQDIIKGILIVLNILLFCGIILYNYIKKGCKKWKNCIIKKNI